LPAREAGLARWPGQPFRNLVGRRLAAAAGGVFALGDQFLPPGLEDWRCERAASQHQTVLLREAVEALDIKPAGTYVDGTFGRGGHTRAILERLGPDGRLLALDCDPQAVAVARAIVDRRLLVMHQRFGDLADALQAGRGCRRGRRRWRAARYRRLVAATG
jgi:hypothetical protein